PGPCRRGEEVDLAMKDHQAVGRRAERPRLQVGDAARMLRSPVGPPQLAAGPAVDGAEERNVAQHDEAFRIGRKAGVRSRFPFVLTGRWYLRRPPGVQVE